MLGRQRLEETLANGGEVWVAEAGQSDFTADWLRRIDADDRKRVHVVQHADWNEEVTTDEKLAFVKEHATYHRIPDGNALDNGTPGFRLNSGHLWDKATANEKTGAIWRLAREIADRYNGVEGRYLNPDIREGGMDFSDVVESCWIFGCDHLRDADAFFLTYLPPALARDVDFAFLDQSLPLEQRVEFLVSQMTVEEKIGQLQDEAPAIPRLKVPQYGWWNEALHGVARNGKATIFPQMIGMGATFDVDLTERVASAISTEARAKFALAQERGNHGKYAGLTFWSPNVNIFRDPRWGRG